MTQHLYKLGIAAALALTLASSYGCGGGNGGTTPRSITPTVFTILDGPGGSPTTFNGIGSNGTVVGFTANNGVNSNFLRSTAGAFTALSLGDPAAGMANAVNNKNMVAGVANSQAFLLANGTQTTLTPPGSVSSIAFGINDTGVIVGQYVAAAGGTTPGFVDVGGTFTTVVPTASATMTNVQGINNSGQAIGFYSTDGVHQHGFLYDIRSRTTTLLPDPSTPRTVSNGLVLTQFLGINDSGEAVGYYQTNNGSQFGFVFSLSSRTYTFVDPPQAAPVNGVQITQITGVSNAAVVSGFFIDANGVQHGFTAAPGTN